MINEDLEAFKQIEKKTLQASDSLTSSRQGETYLHIFWDVMSQYLETNRILSKVPILERPNVFNASNVQLMRIHTILNEHSPNRFTRTRLCLGCWNLVTMDTSSNRYRRNLVLKNLSLPMLIKFSLLVDGRRNMLYYDRPICLEDLIYYLYKCKHEFISKEAQLIYQLPQNQKNLTFMPCPLVKRPKMNNQGPYVGKIR